MVVLGRAEEEQVCLLVLLGVEGLIGGWGDRRELAEEFERGVGSGDRAKKII